MVTFDEEKQKRVLSELRLTEQEDLAHMLSERYELPYIDLSATSINTDALRLIDEDIARKNKVAAFQKTGKQLHIAVLSPKKEDAIATVKDLEEKGYLINLHIASEHSLERAWERYGEISYSVRTEQGVLDIENEEIITYVDKIQNIDGFIRGLHDMLLSKDRYQTTTVLELLIAGALKTEASDIHMEPKDADVKLRLRIDGVLHDLSSFNHRTHKLVLTRIKLLSGLKINVRDEAQDGRFSIKYKNADIEIRTSIIPGAYGESVVLRILNPNAINVKLEDLGIEPKLLKLLNQEIRKPNGMILNTGPTGSGKTTTLYAFLRKISTPEIKIITIEDPIEYHLPNITQTQTDEDAGYTFLEGLHSALRQDPDVIMVGEIRDNETAGTAVNAALTGHLVFSTLHTNNAAGAIPRLIDLAVNPKIIGSAFNLAIAQRLIRRLCQECKQEIQPTPEERDVLEKIVASLPEEEKSGVGKVGMIGKAVGCKECNNTGYKGRIGIFEAIIIDEAIEEVIIQNPSEREIRRAAAPQGLMDMRQDGVVKVLRGVTTFAELDRVIDMHAKIFT